MVIYFIYSSVNIGEGNGNPLQFSCLENPMEGGAWWAAVHGVAMSQTALGTFTFTFHFQALEKEMATHSCLENPRDGGAWWATVYAVAQRQTQLKRISSSSSSINMSMPISQFIATLFPTLVSICLFSTSVSLTTVMTLIKSVSLIPGII